MFVRVSSAVRPFVGVLSSLLLLLLLPSLSLSLWRLLVLVLVLRLLLVLWLLRVSHPQTLSGRSRKPKRTGSTEANRTVSFWNRPEPDAEPNRAEPDRAATRKKTQAEPRRTGKFNSPNRTEPNRLIFEKSRTEPNRAEPVPSWHRGRFLRESAPSPKWPWVPANSLPPFVLPSYVCLLASMYRELLIGVFLAHLRSSSRPHPRDEKIGTWLPKILP